MNRYTILALMIMSLLLTGITTAAEEKTADSKQTTENKEKKSIKIIGFGNSYLANVSGPFAAIAKHSGYDVTFFAGVPGGFELQRHYEKAMLNEKDPEDPNGKPYYHRNRYGKQVGDKMSLKEALAMDKWDYVTIQQSSPNSFKIETYRPYAKNLYDYIKKHAPQAEVVFHQTWPWRPDHTRQNMHLNPKGYMYQELTKAYYTIAKELGIRIIPVGNAFQLAEESPELKFERDPNFDYENPKYPDLPEEKNSLHRGFRWRKKALRNNEKPDEDDAKNYEFILDGSHAGAGAYLAACVWFEFFYQEDVRKIQTAPGHLGELPASLREIAHKTVTEGVRPEAWPKGLEPH